MFERYTERARRVIFFARYEASMYGSITIESEHFLLGLLREDGDLSRFLGSDAAVAIRANIDSRTTIQEKVSTAIDLPLSLECKRILAYAVEEAELLNHRHVGTEHLVLGILREEKCMAAQILFDRGLRISAMREEAAKGRSEVPLIGRMNPDFPEAGCVPDAEMAIRIAEAVWIPVVGLENVEAQRPFHVESSEGTWTVTGTPPGDEKTAPLFALINKADGRILRLTREQF